MYPTISYLIKDLTGVYRNLLLAFAFSISCILLIVYVPTLNYYFHTSSLPLIDWLYPIGVFAVCLFIYEIKKKRKMKKLKGITKF